MFIREQLAAAEVERYYRKAKEILAQNQDFLEKMAPALVDRGFCCPGSEEEQPYCNLYAEGSDIREYNWEEKIWCS